MPFDPFNKDSEDKREKMFGSVPEFKFKDNKDKDNKEEVATSSPTLTTATVAEPRKSNRRTTAELRQEQKNAIIKQHGGLISNIPMNSKYWSL